MKNKKHIPLLAAIFFLALFFRFQNINWDSNSHLHPDERFLTMVGVASKIPQSLEHYLNPSTSLMNPPNIGFPFFVYGIFPVLLNKGIAVLLGNDSYHLFVLQGRVLSGLVDFMVLIFIYRTLLLLEKNKQVSSRVKYWGTFLYAVSVLPIQLSHFYATDSFLNFFMFVAFYFCLRFFYEERIHDLIFASVLFGLALATKISAVYIFPLLIFLLCFKPLTEKRFKNTIGYLLVFAMIGYVALRLADPYYFQTDDFLNPKLNTQYLANIAELQAMSGGKVWFPPSVQWYSKKPVVFSLFNLAFFGLGLPAFFLVAKGMFLSFKKSGKNIVIAWMCLYFLYNSLQYTQTLRYLIFLFPFFAMCGGVGVDHCLSRVDTQKKYAKITRIVLVFLLLLWPMIFSTIYFQNHTRVQASEWIYNNVKDKAVILSEYWDDGLPLPVTDTKGKQFVQESMNVFDPDTEEKWTKMNGQLKHADYYILSSNRGWASIPTVPEKYLKMSRYYADLFDGKTDYVLVKKFIPTYQFLFPFHPNSWINHWFEEAFTVYDHPSVFIFKNKGK